MKRRMIVAGMCVGAWLCGSIQGQDTIVTNLVVGGKLTQGFNSVADGVQATALGENTMAYGDYSHSEGDSTEAGGSASHAEGAFSLAGGAQSHAEGYVTDAGAVNSHAGGLYSRVRQQDSNSFIHATGTSVTNYKETIYPDTAHFDHLVTLAPALNVSNSVLSRIENDQRYLSITGTNANDDISLNMHSLYEVGGIIGNGYGIDIEANASVTTNIWENWNADMLDGYHAASFATTQQMAQKLSVTGGLADTIFKMTVYGGLGPEDQRAQLAAGGDGTISLIGGEETVAEDNMHIKMRWDVAADEPSDPGIDLKPYGGASLRGLGGSDRWWTDGRFCATNNGKTSEFFAVNSGRFIGDGSGLTNLPVTGLTTNAADARYVNASGDTLTGNLVLAGSLRLSNTLETVCAPGFQSDGVVTIHWMTSAGTYFKYGATGGGGDRLHFGSDGSLETWGDIYSRGDIYSDSSIYASSYGGDMGSFPDIPWTSFATTQQMAQKLSVTGGWAASSFNVILDDRTQIKLDENGNIDLVGGEESVYDDNMHIKMRWDVAGDEPSDPCIDLKPYGGASLRGLGSSDRWWTDGRFSATNSGKTSEFFAVSSGYFVGDGSGLANLPITTAASNTFVKRFGDTMTGPLELDASVNQTNLTVAGWAKIDYIPPQGGISMGVYTNR